MRAQETEDKTAMTKRTPRIPTHATDHDGEAVVLVPLANHPEPAKLLQADFNRLMELGYSDQWTYNPAGTGHPYVRCSNSRVAGANETVARVILEPGRGHVVRYRDGNRLNLRFENLYVHRGPAKGQTILSAEEKPDADA